MTALDYAPHIVFIIRPTNTEMIAELTKPQNLAMSMVPHKSQHFLIDMQ